jgi:hypothetical protein
VGVSRPALDAHHLLCFRPAGLAAAMREAGGKRMRQRCGGDRRAWGFPLAAGVMALCAVALLAAASPDRAWATGNDAPRSGLPWKSGVSPGTGKGDQAVENATGFGEWRGRPVDVAVVFLGNLGWASAKGGSYEKMAELETIAPKGAVEALLEAGITPVMTVPLMSSDDFMRFDYVASGAIDEQHQKVADNIAKATNGRRIYLRLGHEADEGYPWSYTNKGDIADPAQYKAAWQRIAAIYRKTVPGAKMVWNLLKNTRQAVADYYPGDDVVDIISIDMYDNGPKFCADEDVWRHNCLGKYDPSTGVSNGIGGILAFAKSHGKKIAIDEWGATNGKNCAKSERVDGDCPLSPDNGANNTFFTAAMFDFFKAHKDDIEYESYYNRAGKGRHQVWPRTDYNALVSDTYLAKYHP